MSEQRLGPNCPETQETLRSEPQAKPTTATYNSPPESVTDNIHAHADAAQPTPGAVPETPTPRTDSEKEYDQTNVDDVQKFARKLERELAAARAEIAFLKRTATNPKGESCSVCKWTNATCNLNIGEPNGEPVWICHGCVKRLRDENERLRSDKARLDFLDALNKRMNEKHGHEYGWRLDQYPNVVSLRDCYANGAESCRAAIDEVMAAQKGDA